MSFPIIFPYTGKTLFSMIQQMVEPIEMFLSSLIYNLLSFQHSLCYLHSLFPRMFRVEIILGPEGAHFV